MNGYKIIDLRDVVIDDENGATISGTYAAIAATDKPTIVKGVNYDGTKLRPQYVAFQDSSGDFVGELNRTYNIVVTDDDLVTIVDVTGE